MPERLLKVVMAAVLVGVGGCGGAGGPERVEVAGKVELDGQPLDAGTITFIPQGTGTAATGPIAEGQYALPLTQGPSPGKCRVEILSYRETGRKVEGPTSDGSGRAAEMKQIIPPRYNTHSELECVLRTEGKNTCDFTLASK